MDYLIELPFDMIRRVVRRPYVLLLLAPFVLLAPIYITGRALFWGTPILQFIPWWYAAWQNIRAGIVPLWNPLLGMGAPLIANYQSGLFYPPNWSYFVLAEIGGAALMAWGQAILVAAHLAWAGVGMSLLLRRLGVNRLAQAIGGLSFGLSSYLVARSGFLSITAAASWIPWIILGIVELDGVRDKGIGDKGKAAITLSLVLAMQLLAGHAQTAWYTLLLAVFWSGFLGLSVYGSSVIKMGENPLDLKMFRPSAVGGEARPKNRLQGAAFEKEAESVERNSSAGFLPKIYRLGWLWAGFGMAILLALVLSAAQLFPTAEYLLESQRAAQVDYDFAMTYSFWPWRFLTLAAPDMFGNPVRGDYWGYANYWEDAVYIGLLPLFLAIGAIIKSVRGKQVRNFHRGLIRFLMPLIVISFVLALGANTPIFPWLYRHVPTFDMFQAPTRITIWAIFSLSVLAGIGAHYWHRPEGRGLYWTRLGTAGAAAVMIGSGLAWYFKGDISPTFIRATALTGFWSVIAGILCLLAPELKLQENEPKTQNVEGDPLNNRYWYWGVGLAVSADLIFAGWGLNPGIGREIYQGESPNAGDLRSRLDGGRIYLPEADEYEIKFDRYFRFDTFSPEDGWQDLRASLLPNLTVFDGINSANNFDPLVPARYNVWIEALKKSDPQAQDRLLNLMGVKVVERVADSQPYQIRFDQRVAFPRLRWVPCAIMVLSEEEALRSLMQGEIDPEKYVVLETGIAASTPKCTGAGEAILEKISESPNKLIVRAQADVAGYLIVGDTWYPGWRAWVDGKASPVLRANYLFRAISLPAGSHEVIVSYRPSWFYLGSILSLLAWSGAGLFYWGLLKQKYFAS